MNGIAFPAAFTDTSVMIALVTGTRSAVLYRSASTSTRTVTDRVPRRSTLVKKSTVSPTFTGALKSMWSIAAVTHRCTPWRLASTNPAWSMYDRITPPKIVPYWFVSLGIITTRSESRRSAMPERTRTPAPGHAPLPSRMTTTDQTGCPGGACGCRLPSVPPVDYFEALPSHDLIARFRRGVQNYDPRMFRLTEAQLDQAFLPDAGVGRWPVRVLLGHVADADLCFVQRMRRAVAEDSPVLEVWDEEAFVDSNIYGNAPGKAPAESPEADRARVHNAIGGFLAVTHTLRQWAGHWLHTLNEPQLARRAMHPQRGEQSVKSILAYATWHLEHHARFLALKLDKLVGHIEDEPAASEACAGGCACEARGEKKPSEGCCGGSRSGSGCGCAGTH